jgi:hypothetical protein
MTTPLIAGGWQYELKGHLRLPDKSIDTEYQYVEHGVIITKGGFTYSNAGFGVLAGVDQPATLWDDLTISGFYSPSKNKDITEFCNVLDTHKIKWKLSQYIQNETMIRFSLQLCQKPGILFLAVPAPYVNGVSIVITKVEE